VAFGLGGYHPMNWVSIPGNLFRFKKVAHNLFNRFVLF
jgi:hypothetical protein